VSGQRLLAYLLLVVGLLLIVVAVIYFAEPAKSLPSFIPGHLAHNTVHRWKRGLAAAILGVFLVILAAIASRPRSTPGGPATL
jgi:hypothetical protein